MTKNITQSITSAILLTLLTAFTFSSQAQAPKMKFFNPVLVSGTDGQEGAMYKFANVITGIDAFVQIENIANGAYLVNIDEPSLGYYNAWQPTVGGPGVGISFIKWGIEFRKTTGEVYTFDDVDASAIDVDGDNSKVREFVGVNGIDTYVVPNQIPSVLQITQVSDTDNVYGDDPSATNIIALGPVANRAGIDTFSQDVRIDYHFINKSKIKIYTGSQVEENGSTAGVAVNRYHCIYFMKIDASLTILPVSYHSFDAVAANSSVNLSWVTEDEKANDHFEIERSFNQRDFKSIGIIVGSQNSDGLSGKYNYNDKDATLSANKEVYYRLKYVDVSGKVSYSNIKRVVLSGAAMNVQVMPNPYMDKLNVNFVSDASGQAEVLLFNTAGSVVKKMQSKINNGYNTLQLQDLNSQLPGLYVLNVMVNGKVIATSKLMKQ